LRLFDLDDQPSQVSATQTPESQSRTHHEASTSQTHTTRAAAVVQDADTFADLSRAAATAALANHALDNAIASARRAGYSWRTIAAHTGIPYQTLHQRAHRHH